MAFLRRATFQLTVALLVVAGPAAAHFSGAASDAASTYYVAVSGDDANAGTAASPWRTIQKAADVAGPGDTVVIEPGTYAGAKFARSGASGSPIRFLADPGVVVDQAGPLNSNGDNLWVRDASYILLQGFEVHSASRAGIAVQGEPESPAVGISVRKNNCHDNSRWGIFTGYAKNFRAIGNTASGSAVEHGIYVSNSADNPVIRGNVVHDNHASGIQINADPALPGDGIITGALVEKNVVYDNGPGGGAAINLASVRSSTFRNNLLYGNHASGIAGWDDGDGSQWGTRNNRFYNNTVVQASDGRFAVSLQNGSSGNTFKNNILFHPGPRGTYDIDASSRSGLVSDYNVVSNVFSVDDTWISFSKWKSYGYDGHSVMRTSTSGLFVDESAADYHLAAGSAAVDRGVTITSVKTDLEGTKRPQGTRYDIGSDERG